MARYDLSSILGSFVGEELVIDNEPNNSQRIQQDNPFKYGTNFLNTAIDNTVIQWSICGVGMPGGCFRKTTFRCARHSRDSYSCIEASVLLSSFQNAQFDACVFVPQAMIFSCSFAGAVFRNCTFEDVQFDTCSFNRTTFENCTFIRCNFNGSFIQDTLLHRCSFEKCELCLQEFDYSRFSNCKFTDSSFSVRQLFCVFGTKELLQQDGLAFSNDDTYISRSELVSELASIARRFEELGRFFPALNAYTVLDDGESCERVFEEGALRYLAQDGNHSLRYFLYLAGGISERLLPRAKRVAVLTEMTQLFAAKKGDASEIHSADTLGLLAHYRESVLAGSFWKPYVSISIGDGDAGSAGAEQRMVQGVLDALERNGIGYRRQRSKNSPPIDIIQVFISNADQLAFILNYVSDLIGGALNAVCDPTSLGQAILPNIVVSGIFRFVEKGNGGQETKRKGRAEYGAAPESPARYDPDCSMALRNALFPEAARSIEDRIPVELGGVHLSVKNESVDSIANTVDGSK